MVTRRKQNGRSMASVDLDSLFMIGSGSVKITMRSIFQRMFSIH